MSAIVLALILTIALILALGYLAVAVLGVWGFFIVAALVLMAKKIFLLCYMFVETLASTRPYHSIVGRVGKAYTTVTEEGGWVLIDGELWRARCPLGKVEKGSQVIVIEWERGTNTLIVQPFFRPVQPPYLSTRRSFSAP